LATDSSFIRPTLEKLIRRAKADISTRLSGADANLRGSPEEVLAISAAGLTHGLHGHLKWLSRQLLTDLSEDEFLVREANVYGLDRTAAVESAGELTITGTNTTVVPAGTVWVRSDGVEYTQDDEVTISGGQATAQLTAVLGGIDGDCDAGTSLTIATPIAGVTSIATVSGSGLTGGTDEEEIEALRARLLLRKRTPPKGGGPGDYVNWALEVSGVTRAWEAPLLLGPGTVGLYFVRDNDVSIIPDAGEVEDVQEYLDTVRPVTADVVAIAPTAVPQAFTVTDLSPDTSDVRDAIEAELQALFTELADPSAAGEIPISKIREAISTASGEDDYTLSSPSANVTWTTGQLRTVGTITWPS
jgi:uncharacterized phage protein gp47/JayE